MMSSTTLYRTLSRFAGLLTLLTVLFASSCRQEEDSVFVGEDPRALQANSALATLLQQTSLFDGSDDNILDMASCISLKLPVSATVNGVSVTIDSVEDYQVVEALFDDLDDDIDSIVFQFPLTVIRSDFSEVTVADISALEALAQTCGGENQPDDDLECADIVYPVSASIFNPDQELIDVELLEDDKDLYDLIEDLNEGKIIATLQFPISVRLSDGSLESAGSLEQLEAILQSAAGTCDEDDDNDYNDDDCDTCTTQSLADVLTGCTAWIVDKLEVNDTDLEDNYADYQFQFNADGSLVATSGAGSDSGTWSASGTGNDIQVTMNIPTLPDFSAVWTLHEIQTVSELNVDLRQANGDRLRFEGACSGSGGGDGSSDTTLTPVLTSGTWGITSYLEDGVDATAPYTAYVFTFNTDGSVTADNGSMVTGTWFTTNAGAELSLDFSSDLTLDEFSDSWDVVQVTDTQVTLRDVSGDGSTDDLIFEKR